MFLRSAALACAAAMIAALAAPATAETARCDATSFRVYFAQGSARLTPAARETIEAAARTVAGCEYSELRVALDASSPQASRRAALRVALDASSPQASRRAAAIRAAAGDNWDAVRVTPRMLQRASASPDYAEIEMSPYPAPTHDTSAPAETDAGV
jgi:hypothetical protein